MRFIVGDAGFEHATSAPEVWCAANEPPQNKFMLNVPNKNHLANNKYSRIGPFFWRGNTGDMRGGG